MARGGNRVSSGGTGVILSSRLSVLLLLFAAAAIAIVARLVYLQVIVADEYSEAAASSRTISIELTARRGTIYDRNGKVLATSIDATTIYVNPAEVEDITGTAEAIAEVLGGDAEDYEAIIDQDTTFAYIERQADVDVAEELQALDLDGIYFVEDTKRVYPYGEIGGQIIGFVDVDGEGICGLELYYDDILTGESGQLVVQQGADGTTIPGGTEVEVLAVDGQDIVISIDIDMQEALEEILAEGVEDLGGEDGTAMLMDAESGEILAIASTPYFDPSDTSTVEDGATSIKAISTQYEPGSIFKAVSAMAMLEAGVVNTETSIYCPVEIDADEYTISDAGDRSAVTYTLTQVIAKSSNVGIALLVAEYLDFAPLYEKIIDYGLNETTGVDYPGEASGYLTDESTWSTVQSYNVTFGQGLMVTPLQMTRFYAALANDGVACTPHFLISLPQSDEDVEWDSEQIIEDTEAIESMTEMLEAVITDGTGTSAAIDGYTVAGKTGTAEYADDTGAYVSDLYNVDFVGYLPNASMSLVCFVGVNHVSYGNKATGIFKDIMTEAISRYRVIEN